jgi:hypothetical protein
MNKAVIHIEVDDCLSDCPFAEYKTPTTAYCNRETWYIDSFPENNGATPVPDWCPYKVQH